MAQTRTHPLVGDRIGRLAHELVDALDRHLRVELLEHSVALLESEKYILLDQRELDRGDLRVQHGRSDETHELLQRLELVVRLDKQLLLVLAPS